MPFFKYKVKSTSEWEAFAEFDTIADLTLYVRGRESSSLTDTERLQFETKFRAKMNQAAEDSDYGNDALESGRWGQHRTAQIVSLEELKVVLPPQAPDGSGPAEE